MIRDDLDGLSEALVGTSVRSSGKAEYSAVIAFYLNPQGPLSLVATDTGRLLRGRERRIDIGKVYTKPLQNCLKLSFVKRSTVRRLKERHLRSAAINHSFPRSLVVCNHVVPRR